MSSSNFIRFFDKLGNDMNLGSTSSEIISLYTGATSSLSSLYGKVFFPKVSVGLVESQQLFILQEVTGPTASFQLRKVPGEVIVTSGNPTVTGVDADFSVLQVGTTVKIGTTDFSVSATGSTSFQVSPSPSISITTTDIYFYDYLSYNAVRTSPNTFEEKINVYVDSENRAQFFLYDINYTEEYPTIDKFYESDYELENGSSDTIDPLTGRIQLSSILTLPTQINLGFSSGATAIYDDIYEQPLKIVLEKTYQQQLSSSPVISSTEVVFSIGGTSHDLFNYTLFYCQGVTATGATSVFYNQQLNILSVGVSGSDTLITAEIFDVPGISFSNLSNYRILWKNDELLATLDMYGEIEAEDERFKLVLENFGKKIDFENEYIFRDSDIHEELPDFSLLNKKRKELLLEGDNIYPYMGSYRALINIINFFGYYDLRIKEYFLNVDANSTNFGKYMHVLVPRDASQRNQVRDAWQIVPSSIYKKTSLFGLFYDINKATDNEDVFGIPEVVDSFDFSPEEVLIKLFGLKELLKREYLPLNARIYDITGEGIYFERIRVDSWADNLNHLVVNLGKTPEFELFPKTETYITDLRRIDQFYIDRFTEQGLVGFIGSTALDPFITALTGSTGPISELYGTYLESYALFLEEPYTSLVDQTWAYMPPGISNPDFNYIASRLTPLPDDENIVAGGPVLLEAHFDITWEESDFTWLQLGILGPSGSPLNINHWTWQSIGRGEFIEMRWIASKGGSDGFFYDSGRKPIDDFLVEVEGKQNYAVRAKLAIEMSEPLGPTSYITSISIVNPGFGYTSAPIINVWAPGGTGTPAIITSTINSDGYVDSVTLVDPGMGYNFVPFVSVEEPSPVYNIDYRYLNAIALPYVGEYDISLYLYDITNGFSVDFQKYNVKSWNVDFVSIARQETYERTWNDFSNHVTVGTDSQHLITWDEVTGPWYYPLHVSSSWDDAQTSWESLNFSSYSGDSLYNYDLSTTIVEINRESELVVLSGDITGNLNNMNILNVGDYLFFRRESGETIESNIRVFQNSFGSALQGMVGINQFDALVTGITGATVLDTTPYDTSSFVSIGDQLLIQGTWYNTMSVGATYVEIASPLTTQATSVLSLVYPLSGEIQVSTFYSDINLPLFSRILCTETADYSLLDPTQDFYGYIDGLTFSGGIITVTGEESTLKSMIATNSNVYTGNTLYMTWGLFSGTYAIEITNISLTGGNTQFRLNDVNKELFYLDGNFSIKLADYDVDYAENRIGPNSLTYQNSEELTWEENNSLTWFGLEYHGTTLCGYVIPFVSPGGNITIDENDTFVLSSDIAINSTQAGLTVAAQEMNVSLNSGIIKYDYTVLPEIPLNINDSTGASVSVLFNVAPGATQIPLGGTPSGGMRIPAKISVTITGGVVTGVSIDNPGWGYTNLPTIVVSSPGGTGTVAEISCTITGLPYEGQVNTVTIVIPGSGYLSIPTVEIQTPTNFKALDNFVWTGSEWLEVSHIDSIAANVLNLVDIVNFPIYAGDSLLLPYQYHKQIFSNLTVFQQFYFFIHGKAKNPSTEMLSYVTLGNGIESEWGDHPGRTFTYPLRNSFYFLSIPEYNNLTQDYLYNKWVYEGSDYPPLTVYSDYSSDVLSYESRIPYAQTLQSSFSFIDTVVSSSQQIFKQFTPVVFSFDKCRIPGKTNAMWSIKNQDTGNIEVMSNETKLMWNFSKIGDYTVELNIEDSNGNVLTGKKNSFVIIDGK